MLFRMKLYLRKLAEAEGLAGSVARGRLEGKMPVTRDAMYSTAVTIIPPVNMLDEALPASTVSSE